eukprot:2407800-Pyramimonas_sp.AAC.1
MPLVPVMSELVSTVLYFRIQPVVENRLQEEQRIFRNGRGCDDAAHVLRTVVEKSAERGGDLRLAALDVEKAIGK